MTSSNQYWIHHWLPEDKISFRREVFRRTFVDGKITEYHVMDVASSGKAQAMNYTMGEWHTRSHLMVSYPQPDTVLYNSTEELVEALLAEWDQDLKTKLRQAKRNWRKARAATMKLI